MPRFSLADEHIDRNVERAVLAAVALDADVARDNLPALTADHFPAEAEVYAALVAAHAAGSALAIPADWQPAADLPAALKRLGDSLRRRQVATLVERLAATLPDRTVPADDFLRRFAEDARALADDGETQVSLIR